MLRKLLTENKEVDQSHVIENIYKSLQHILRQLETEVAAKRRIIEEKEQDTHQLKSLIEEKDSRIEELNNKLVDCQHNVDGNRQLVNKLLNDIERMQQEIEWYKRTYENRSVVGTLKEKLLGKSKY